MPELPEVQTTVDGLTPYLLNQQIRYLVFYRDNLRYPLEQQWIEQVSGQDILAIYRRAKMIVMQLNQSYLVWHLGMSGSMRVTDSKEKRRKHDHVEIQMDDHDKKASNHVIRFHDPRRFGYLRYYPDEKSYQASIAHLGLEPLDDAFNGDYLYQQTRQKKQAVKTAIMDQSLVVGVGNIYACEALFMAGIDPRRAAHRISRKRYQCLAESIKTVLQNAIAQGGTTLRDFVNANANPGYFQQQLFVYGRDQLPCPHCQAPIIAKRIGGRNSFYCSTCQL